MMEQSIWEERLYVSACCALLILYLGAALAILTW